MHRGVSKVGRVGKVSKVLKVRRVGKVSKVLKASRVSKVIKVMFFYRRQKHSNKTMVLSFFLL